VREFAFEDVVWGNILSWIIINDGLALFIISWIAFAIVGGYERKM